MKKLLFVFGYLTAISCVNQLAAQFIEKKGFEYNNNLYDVFIIKVDSELAKRISIEENLNRLGGNEFNKYLASKLQVPFFFVTASIVDSTCTPLGLYVNSETKKGELNMKSGNGNFYLKPNGFFFTDSVGHVGVLAAEYYKSTNPFRNAIQSGPMLVSDKVINPQFDKNSKNKFLRCGVGLYKESNNEYLIFASSQVPVSFYQFSELFLDKYNCENALNLESSSNCIFHLPNTSLTTSSKSTICRYIVIKM